MSIVFREYELLAASGWFDPEYYVRSNPDVAASNVDPLMHYLEWGAKEGRNPSARFDAAEYLSRCGEVGQRPANALVHYLNFGREQGLEPRPVGETGVTVEPGENSAGGAPARSPGSSEILLSIDAPALIEGRAAVSTYGGLTIAGWALAAQGVVKIEVAIDAHLAAAAVCGIRRPDVLAQYGGWHNALQSGFAVHVPPRLLTEGAHAVAVTARDRHGGAVTREFVIDMTSPAADHGPWSLRRKMHQSEVSVKLAILASLQHEPVFRIVVTPASAADDGAALRRTLSSLNVQTYPRWTCAAHSVQNSDLKKKGRAKRKSPGAHADPRFTMVIEAGDELGCDALLELALAGGFDRNADLIYSDERRVSPVDGKAQAFFKPDWSPDLLTSTPYLGRAWCAADALFATAGLDPEIPAANGYDGVLKLSESAKSIVHVAKVLFQQSDEQVDRSDADAAALQAMCARREIEGQVAPGLTSGHYRLQRKIASSGRVSIVIPTCAAGGLIKTCLESLRDVTTDTNYDVVCVENIPKSDRKRWTRWLGQYGATLVSSDESFNWSRFNNRGAVAANGAYLLFLNDDIEVIEPDWLGALLEHAQRPEVGVAGPQLLYPDRRVQHAGITLDRSGRGRHTFRHQQQRDPGYFGLALTQRNVIGVTGACLMTRRDTFERLGGFDEAHAVVNGDLDYCLKSWRAGLRNLYTPYSRLIHHEMASRSQLEEKFDVQVHQKRWAAAIDAGDPFFSPHLTADLDQFMIEREPVEEVYAAKPLFAHESIERILVVKLDHIGDCITALPAVQRLKQAFPAARLTVLAGRATRAIWDAEPGVDDLIEFDFFHARSGLGTVPITEADLESLKERLLAQRFDLAIDLRKQPETRPVLPLSGARILGGFDTHGRFPWLDVALEWDEDVPLRNKRTHVSTDLSTLVELVISCSDHQSASPAPVALPPIGNVDTQRLFAKPLVCIHVCAGSEMRQWPLPYFAALVSLLLDTGRLNVAVIGGAEDGAAAEKVIGGVARHAEVFNLVGRFTLDRLPAILARVALFIGNNSGPQHLAAHLGIPTVGIHSGVVDAREWGPSGRYAVAVRRQMTCSPCFIEHAKDCPRSLACLRDLSVREVFNTSMRMLACNAPHVHEQPRIRGIAHV